MVRVVDCHAGVLGSNPGVPKDFSLWNYFRSFWTELDSANNNNSGPKDGTLIYLKFCQESLSDTEMVPLHKWGSNFIPMAPELSVLTCVDPGGGGGGG